MTALREAYELIRDKERWTSGAPAIDAHGDWVGPDNPSATRWCVAGAVVHACKGDEKAARVLLRDLKKTARELFPAWTSVVSVNDFEGHEAIVQVLEKAIVQAEGSL